MVFETDDDLQKFIKGEKFYKNVDCYCLGKTLEDAAEIARQLIADLERK